VFGAEGAALDELRELLPPMVLNASRLAVMPPIVRRDFGAWSPGRKLTSYRQRYDDIIARLISDIRNDPKFDDRNDVLSLMLQARYEDGSPISDDHVADELLTLLAAGHETTCDDTGVDRRAAAPPPTVTRAGDRRGRRGRFRAGAGHDMGGAAHPPGDQWHRSDDKDPDPVGGVGHSGETRRFLPASRWRTHPRTASPTPRPSIPTDSSATRRTTTRGFPTAAASAAVSARIRQHGDDRHLANLAARVRLRHHLRPRRTPALAWSRDGARARRSRRGVSPHRQARIERRPDAASLA